MFLFYEERCWLIPLITTISPSNEIKGDLLISLPKKELIPSSNFLLLSEGVWHKNNAECININIIFFFIIQPITES